MVRPDVRPRVSPEAGLALLVLLIVAAVLLRPVLAPLFSDDPVVVHLIQPSAQPVTTAPRGPAHR